LKIFKLTVIVIILLLSLIGCESRKHKQIKAMMEVGEYAPAMVLLNAELLEDVKNVELREMLIICYEKQELWAGVIKQIEVINNIEPEKNYDFLLMRAYSLLNQIDEAKIIKNKYPNYHSSLISKYDKNLVEIIKKIKIPSDSLRDIDCLYSIINPDTLDEFWKYIYDSKIKLFNGDSLLEKNFFYYTKKNESVLNEEKLQYYKENHLQDWYLVGIMSEVCDDSPNITYLEDDVKEMLQIDSTYIDYIYEPIMTYANSLIKPNIYDKKYGHYTYFLFYNEIVDYYKKRSVAFKILRLFKKSLDAKGSEIYWTEFNDENPPDDVSLYFLYGDYIDFLKEMNDYKHIVSFAELKMKKFNKSNWVYESLKLEKNKALEKLK